ncbi:MAG: dihydrofolate reductase [Phycisphaeraceae bacterium]
MPMQIAIIVAVADNGVIGRGLALPWRLSADLQRFRALTTGHTVVMGRRTWESIRRALPQRRMVVITRQPDYAPGVEGVAVAHDLMQAIDDAQQAGEAELFIIGGRALYEAALPIADTLHLTRVHAGVEGDVRFPEVDWSGWTKVSSEDHARDERNEHDFTFERYQRPVRPPMPRARV